MKLTDRELDEVSHGLLEIAREAAAAEARRPHRESVVAPAAGSASVGARVDARDPLAVLAFGKQGDITASRTMAEIGRAHV